jgi:hypothetical protein
MLEESTEVSLKEGLDTEAQRHRESGLGLLRLSVGFNLCGQRMSLRLPIVVRSDDNHNLCRRNVIHYSEIR